MQTNEYLVMFSNEGEVEVSVKLDGIAGRISSRRMRADEVTKLISPDGCGFVSSLTVDEWPVVVKKYEVDPINGKLIIHAKHPS